MDRRWWPLVQVIFRVGGSEHDPPLLSRAGSDREREWERDSYYFGRPLPVHDQPCLRPSTPDNWLVSSSWCKDGQPPLPGSGTGSAGICQLSEASINEAGIEILEIPRWYTPSYASMTEQQIYLLRYHVYLQSRNVFWGCSMMSWTPAVRDVFIHHLRRYWL